MVLFFLFLSYVTCVSVKESIYTSELLSCSGCFLVSSFTSRIESPGSVKNKKMGQRGAGKVAKEKK